MKSLFTILSLFLFSSFINAQNKEFDQKLADSLGADQYGMKTYFLVILKKRKSRNYGQSQESGVDERSYGQHQQTGKRWKTDCR